MVIRLKRPAVVDEQQVPPIVPEKKSEPVRGSMLKQWYTAEKISPGMIAVFCALGLGIVGGAGMFWYRHQAVTAVDVIPKVNAATSTPTALSEIIRKVSKLMALPNDEEPTLAMVRDVTSLKEQSFFKNAKNGDFVLMYAKARRAILYDAIGNKIIEVAPIIDTPSAQP